MPLLAKLCEKPYLKTMTQPKSNSEIPAGPAGADPKQHLLHLSRMKETLERTTIPLLGLSEPTISAAGTRRLHEDYPMATQQSEAHIRPVEDIVLEYADFVRAQRKAQPDQPQVELPLLVQYDLYHLAEAMPETRAGAPHDTLHSFFHRQEAVDTILDHCQYFLDRQGLIMLMWHTYHPAWEDLDFYRITNQTGTYSPVVFDDTMNNPFNMMHLPDALSRAMQQNIIKQTIDELVGAKYASRLTLSFRKKLDHIADFAKALARRNGSAIFRPYHEHSPGNWFWWCLDNLSDDPNEAARLYRKLFHQTRVYLEQQGVDNLLYCYSPDLPYQRPFTNKADFLEHYHRGMPDIEQVDVLGLDAYLWKLFTADDQQDYADASARANEEQCYDILARPWERALQICTWLREEYPDKIVGLTETGWNYQKWGDLEEKPIETFWQEVGTERVLFLEPQERPHFLCLWRNDIGDRYCPWNNGSPRFAEEATALANALMTYTADVPKEPPVI